MVYENIDIALILSINAGKRLSDAHTVHLKMSKKGVPSKVYFQLRAEEREDCIEAVILFQASMEAVINEEFSKKCTLPE